MEKIFTVFQASKYCNVSPKTIINWIDAGHIEAYRTVGGHRRIKKDDLEAFMRKQGIPVPEEEPTLERKRILIVDDDPIIVETLVQALEEDEHDYEIISASDGFEAGIQVNHFKPHLLILDIMMPGMDGWQAARELKANLATKDIPILAATALFRDTDLKTCMDSGCSGYIVKPFTFQELHAKVKELIPAVDVAFPR